ncbi:MAG: maleylacetoacetate isomerase [Sandaracinaceae bacterium]
MRLYSWWTSSCSYRARIALNLKGLAYDLVSVSLNDGNQLRDDFKTKNPSMQVPVLELDDGTQLAQSIAILEYLDEVHPEPPLMPKDPIARARCRQLTEIVNSGIQPMQNRYLGLQLKREHGIDPKTFAAHYVARGLDAYDAVAATTAGRFSVGDHPTIADVVLVPQLIKAREMDLDVAARWPRLQSIDAACMDMAAFRDAHPDDQPDSPR